MTRPPNLKSRFNAASLELLESAMHRLLGARKQRLFSDLPKSFVEIGPGAGANFRYYPKGSEVTLIEPGQAFHRRLAKRAEEHGLSIEIHGVGAENSGLRDASVEVIVSTLVLCSVKDAEQTLAEMKRILKPGGRFIFLEHVAAKPNSLRRRIQKELESPWRWCFDGCELCRDTPALLEEADFSELSLTRYLLNSPAYPINTQIEGVARR